MALQVNPNRKYNKAFKSRRGVKRPTEGALKLWEKQKMKEVYGIREAQSAGLLKKFNSGAGEENGSILSFIERRLDNVVFRLGAAATRKSAKQQVTHSKIRVNGTITNSPSYLVSVGDTIKISKPRFSEDSVTPEWLELNRATGEAKVIRLPLATEIEPDIDERLILEYYSK
jgi:small subunit ribosomal protein S4